MMKQLKQWLGIMMSVMLAAEILQVPVYAVETEETAVEAALEAVRTESAVLADDETEEVTGAVDDAAKEETEIDFLKGIGTSMDEEEQSKDNTIENEVRDDEQDAEGSEIDGRFIKSNDDAEDANEYVEETIEEDEKREAAEAVIAKGTCGNSLTWELDSEGILIISGSGKMKDYTANNKNPWASRSVKKVIINEGVTSIGNRAFYNCKTISAVEIPVSITTIGSMAFGFCDISEIVLPDGISTIGGSAFMACSNLERINTPNSLVNMGDSVFHDCSSLSEFTLPTTVTKIGVGWFAGCSNLKSIEIPESVTSIEQEAFYGCSSLESVIIPQNVISIGANAFAYCSNIRSITFSGDAPYIESGSDDYDMNAFIEVKSIAYYPSNNATWKSNVKQQYGGELTWVPYGLITILLREEDSIQSYTGSEIKPLPEVKNSQGFILTEGKDYTLSYSDNIEPGTATITANGIGDYSGQSVSVEFIIEAIDFTTARVMMMYDFEDEDHHKCIAYKGSEITPVYDVCVGKDEKSLEENKDYTLSYKDNKDIGIAKCTVKGIGNYHGEFTVEFWIVPGKVKNLRGNNDLSTETVAYTNYRRGLEIIWDAQQVKDIKYEIQYSKTDDFREKEIMADRINEYSELEKPLDRNSTYYVRVRAYLEKEDEVYINGEWSDILQVNSGNSILSEEFFGMSNSSEDLKDLKKTDARFLKRIFDDGPANALFDAMLSKEIVKGYGDGKEISLGGGICFGMDVVALAAIAYGLPFDQYGYKSRFEIDSFTKARTAFSQEFDISAEDMMRYAFFLQYADEFDNLSREC